MEQILSLVNAVRDMASLFTLVVPALALLAPILALGLVGLVGLAVAWALRH